MSDFNNYLIEQLQDDEFKKEYMNETLAEYIENGNFNAFFRSLEFVIKARDNISSFC
jgi:hypothetical protein